MDADGRLKRREATSVLEDALNCVYGFMLHHILIGIEDFRKRKVGDVSGAIFHKDPAAFLFQFDCFSSFIVTDVTDCRDIRNIEDVDCYGIDFAMDKVS